MEKREEKRLLCRGIKKRRGAMRKNSQKTHFGILLGVMTAMLISVIPIISMSQEIESEILVYEYEQENDLIAVSSVIMPFKKDFGKELNETETSIKYSDKKLVFNISSETDCIKEYKVIDVTGRTVEKKTLKLRNGLNRIEMPVSMRTGIYFVQINGQKTNTKITVLK